MQTINRKIGDFDDINFEVDLSTYGKVGDNVVDITFLVKSNKTDQEADAVLTKKLSNGQISHTGTTVLNVLVQWPEDGYETVSAGNTYIAGLYLKFSGDPVHDEHTDDLFHVVIKEGFMST
jgi:hypothetical protein